MESNTRNSDRLALVIFIWKQAQIFNNMIYIYMSLN